VEQKPNGPRLPGGKPQFVLQYHTISLRHMVELMEKHSEPTVSLQ
jgi:hypothetical protein